MTIEYWIHLPVGTARVVTRDTGKSEAVVFRVKGKEDIANLGVGLLKLSARIIEESEEME